MVKVIQLPVIYLPTVKITILTIKETLTVLILEQPAFQEEIRSDKGNLMLQAVMTGLIKEQAGAEYML